MRLAMSLERAFKDSCRELGMTPLARAAVVEDVAGRGATSEPPRPMRNSGGATTPIARRVSQLERCRAKSQNRIAKILAAEPSVGA